VKKLALVLFLVGAGVIAYAGFLSPERRACSKLVSLCGGEGDHSKALAQCHDQFAQMQKSVPEEAPKLAQCINESTSCGGAMGCGAGSALRMGINFGKDFFEGLGRALGGNNSK